MCLYFFTNLQGTYGWRLDNSVHAYQSYQEGDAPPEPECYDVERVNEESGLQELVNLGLVSE